MNARNWMLHFGALALVGMIGCTSLTPKSRYVALDSAFKLDISKSGIVPILVFEDDRARPVYDESPLIPTLPTSGGGIAASVADGIVALATSSLNNSVLESRRRDALQASLPIIDVLTKLDLTTDFATAVFSETAATRWLKLGDALAISKSSLQSSQEEARRTDAALEFFPPILESQLATHSEQYYLTLDFRQRVQNNYVLWADVSIYSRKLKLVVYRAELRFGCEGTKSPEWARWWADSDGLRLRRAYEAGIRSLASALVHDLGSDAPLNGRDASGRDVSERIVVKCQPALLPS